MNFIDDINLVTGIGRLITYAVQNFADVVHAGTRSCVQFQNVYMAGSCNRLAIFTNAARVDRRTAIAVCTGAV